jgi:hypothetical protein
MSLRSLVAIGALSALLGGCTEGQSGPEAPENVLSGTVGTENNLAARLASPVVSGVLPGAKVYLWDPSRGSQPVDSTLADTRGRFVFRNLGAGPWVVSVATDSIGAVSGRRLLAGADIVDLVLLEPQEGQTLEGVRILGIPGVQEVSGNRVRLQGIPGQKLELSLILRSSSGKEQEEPAVLESSPSGVTVRPVAPSGTTSIPDSALTVRWTFDGSDPSAEATGRGPTLPPGLPVVSSPLGKAFDGAFSVAKVLVDSHPSFQPGANGRLGFVARVRLDSYPAKSTYNGTEFIGGFYPSLKFGVDTAGAIQVACQRWTGSAYAWYAPFTAKGTMPLGRWVDLAVAMDTTDDSLRVWVDGRRVALLPAAWPGTTLRLPGSWAFSLGNDAQDDQDFHGLIEEFRIYQDLPYAP